jgi:hypothetical protein
MLRIQLQGFLQIHLRDVPFPCCRNRAGEQAEGGHAERDQKDD